MSKTAKGLLIAAFCILAVWAGLATLYTYSVSEELTMLRREGRSDIIYLRCRIRDLESELSAHSEGNAPAPSVSDDEASTDSVKNEVSPDSDGITADKPVRDEEATEGVTIPTLNTPETIPPTEDETAAETVPAAPYLVTAHEGIIGLFDTTGALLKTVNVYIMTLPAADRAALEVGIPAGSWAEALRLLEMYE
ncbi:MAG: hypothetical protein IKM33_06290 [Clostridia bacterium]|nr:hypothetical protein [Clostridia bacterium]